MAHSFLAVKGETQKLNNKIPKLYPHISFFFKNNIYIYIFFK